MRKKIRISAAVFFCMVVCILAVPQKTSATTTIQGKIANLDQVRGLKAGACTSKSINFHWLLGDGADGYEVYRAEARNGRYALISSLSQGSQAFMNTSVFSGKEYFYKVRAYVEEGKGRSCGKFSKILRVNTKTLSRRIVKAKCNINVRKYAGTNYARIFGVPSGASMTVLCETCDKAGVKWYRIQIKMNGKKRVGYVRGDLVA